VGQGLLNAVLRRAQREGEELLAGMERDPVVRTAHPRWLQKSLKAFWPSSGKPSAPPTTPTRR
jgi:16S rRNA m(5)C-967 methyltransferase (EC 2.1.1.-)